MLKFFLLLSLILSGLCFAADTTPEPMKPIKEVFEPSGNFPADKFIKVAVVQNKQKRGADITNKDAVQKYKEENIRELENYIRKATDNGANLVVTPEYGIAGYPQVSDYQFKTKEDVKFFVEAIPGPTTEYFSRLAVELKTYISINLLEDDSAKKNYFNTHVLISPEGKIVGKHRKYNLFKTERDFLAGGEGPTIIDTPWGKTGLMVCADSYQVLLLSKLLRKVDTLIIQASWTDNNAWDYFKATSLLTNTNVVISNQHFFPDSGVINASQSEQSHIRQSEGIAYGYLKKLNR